MTDESEDMVDALLRDQFVGPLADDGFCDRVMNQLPAKRRRHHWPLAAGAFAGVAAYGISLWSAPITNAGWRDWLAGEMSASVMTLFISMIGMAVLALAWAIAEADDRSGPSSPRIRP